MTSPDEFLQLLKRLGAAFDRPLGPEVIQEYFGALHELPPARLAELVDWAILNLDTRFPTVAALRHHATDLGWFDQKQPRDVDGMYVDVTCPRCGGGFVVRRSKLIADAKEGKVYECPNRVHWGCTMTWRSAVILETNLKQVV